MKTFDIRNSKLTGPTVVILIFGLFYWLDTIQIVWRRQAVQTFTMKSFVYFSGALLVLFAILIIFLAWFLFVYSRLLWFTSTFYLLIGTFVLGLLYSSFSANPFLRSIFHIDPFTNLWYVISSRGFESMTLQAGAFVLVFGLVGLVCKIRERALSS